MSLNLFAYMNKVSLSIPPILLLMQGKAWQCDWAVGVHRWFAKSTENGILSNTITSAYKTKNKSVSLFILRFSTWPAFMNPNVSSFILYPAFIIHVTSIHILHFREDYGAVKSILKIFPLAEVVSMLSNSLTFHFAFQRKSRENTFWAWRDERYFSAKS